MPNPAHRRRATVLLQGLRIDCRCLQEMDTACPALTWSRPRRSPRSADSASWCVVDVWVRPQIAAKA